MYSKPRSTIFGKICPNQTSKFALDGDYPVRTWVSIPDPTHTKINDDQPRGTKSAAARVEPCANLRTSVPVHPHTHKSLRHSVSLFGCCFCCRLLLNHHHTKKIPTNNQSERVRRCTDVLTVQSPRHIIKQFSPQKTHH